MRHIFIDFDDTLSDMNQFVQQFTRAIAYFLQPKFGGALEDWEMSAFDMVVSIMEDYNHRFASNPLSGYCMWLNNRDAESSRLIFDKMGLPLPDNSITLAAETQQFALSRCNCLYPGAVQVLAEIRKLGAKIHIASANDSIYLYSALRGAGIERSVDILFGPDLVDCAKEGPEYYEKIFRHAGVSASDVVVVDDKPEALEWAMYSGAKAVQARMALNSQTDMIPNVQGLITNLQDLPSLITTII